MMYFSYPKRWQRCALPSSEKRSHCITCIVQSSVPNWVHVTSALPGINVRDSSCWYFENESVCAVNTCKNIERTFISKKWINNLKSWSTTWDRPRARLNTRLTRTRSSHRAWRLTLMRLSKSLTSRQHGPLIFTCACKTVHSSSYVQNYTRLLKGCMRT